jgi:hypothetical protein
MCSPLPDLIRQWRTFNLAQVQQFLPFALFAALRPTFSVQQIMPKPGPRLKLRNCAATGNNNKVTP